MNESPAPAPSPGPTKPAQSVLLDYGVATVALVIWVVLCIKDGWFREPDYQYVGFNRLMTYVFTPILVFCAVMAGSAARACWRAKKSSPPPSAPPPASGS